MTQGSRRSTLGKWIGFATALMSALAGGAVWSVLVLRSGYELTAFAFVIAATIALVLRGNGYAGTRLGAFLAALFTAFACIYAQCLLAVGDVAQAMGFSLRDTLLRIGADFALAVVRGYPSALSRQLRPCHGACGGAGGANQDARNSEHR
jgi:hypothetical protein